MGAGIVRCGIRAFAWIVFRIIRDLGVIRWASDRTDHCRGDENDTCEEAQPNCCG